MAKLLVAASLLLFASQPSMAMYPSWKLDETRDTANRIEAKLDELIAIEKEQNELLKQVRNKLASIEDNQW